MHRDLEEIRELGRSNDRQFSSLLYESEHINRLLDAYAGSLAYLDEKHNTTTRCITDKTSERIYGVDGKLHYTYQHFNVVTNLLNSLFTPSHVVWMNYNPEDSECSGERDRAINIIRRNLVNDLIPRTVMIIKSCQDSELQQKEM